MTEQTTRSLNIVFIAFVSTTFVYLFLGFLMRQTSAVARPMEGSQQIIFLVSVALSLAQVVVVWILCKRTYSEEQKPQSLEVLENHLRSRHIILFALSEIPAIYGIVYFFLTGHFAGQIILTLFSWICLAISKPSLTAIEKLERRLGF
jgi:F0F1-type ATP synthase membrane subunit c/vacuolar-type H+-ATPase subunit K